MEDDLYDYLTASGSLIAAAVGERIAWDENKQGEALPRIVLTLVDTVPEYASDGEAGLSASRVQVDVYASSAAEARDTAGAVKERTSGVQFTQGDTEFDGIYVESDRASTEDGEGGGERTHRRSIDLMIWHRST